jgi:hypothetical protein
MFSSAVIVHPSPRHTNPGLARTALSGGCRRGREFSIGSGRELRAEHLKVHFGAISCKKSDVAVSLPPQVSGRPKRIKVAGRGATGRISKGARRSIMRLK